MTARRANPERTTRAALAAMAKTLTAAMDADPDLHPAAADAANSDPGAALQCAISAKHVQPGQTQPPSSSSGLTRGPMPESKQDSRNDQR